MNDEQIIYNNPYKIDNIKYVRNLEKLNKINNITGKVKGEDEYERKK